MEAETLPSLSGLLQGADQWREVLLLLPLLVALEVVLSADNAIALAAISRRLHDPDRQRQALNLGLALALVFRLLLVVAARWVLRFWPLQLLAAGYLLWLCGSQLLAARPGAPEPAGPEPAGSGSTAVGPQGPPAADWPQGTVAVALPSVKGLVGVVLTLGVTDLAFSLDSVAAAVAVTDRLALVMVGGVIGVVALRLTAELFIRWLEEFRHLETSGYLAVGLVGIRLLVRLAFPGLVVPEWAVLLSVGLLFAWGFSDRSEPPAVAIPGSTGQPPTTAVPTGPAAPTVPTESDTPTTGAAADAATGVGS
jgi:YkoY family integral membrane protein